MKHGLVTADQPARSSSVRDAAWSVARIQLCLHQIQQAIEPNFPLKDTPCLWNQIARSLAQGPLDYLRLRRLRAILAAQHTVQIECGADQGEVCKGLREVAQGLALRPRLFRVESEMIGIPQHTFKQQPGIIQLFGI